MNPHDARRFFRLGAVLVAVSSVGVGCGGDTPTQTEKSVETSAPSATTTPTSPIETQPESEPVGSIVSGPEPTASPELSTLVDVSIECSHGTQLGALPFDAGQIGFLSGNPDDTSWVTQVVTITNHADVHVAVTPGFTVRYVARDGATLGTASLDEPYPPAFTAAPDQTVHRNTVRFDLPGRGGLVPEPTLAAALYTDLAACGIDDEVTITPIAADEFIDPDLVDRTELVNCGLDATGSRYEGTLRVANSGDETLDVEFGFEILDGGGNRLGIGGNERDRVEASAQTDVVGWAATFTVVDPTQVQSCRLLALTAT